MSDDAPKGFILSEEKEKPKRKGSIFRGVLFGLILTVLLELGVGLALNVETNLVDRYMAYILGLLPIIVCAIISRSILKMIFIGTPILVLSSFALPYFLPDIFSGLMTPFFTLLQVALQAIGAFEALGIDPAEQGIDQIIVLIEQYGFLIDAVLGLIVASMVGIGIAAGTKVLTRKFGIVSIILAIIAVFFITLGLIVLPYALVVVSGVAQFGLSLGAGGALISQGVVESAEGNLTDANALFAEAEIWFNQSESMLNGLQALGVFTAAGQFNPTYKVIIDNGVILMNAAVDLAQGISPALAGFGAISQGIEQAMGALETATPQLTLQQTDDTEFNEGIAKIEQGFENFTDAVVEIKEAITEISSLDQDELNTALIESGAGDQTAQLDLLLSALSLLNATLDVFTNEAETGLINDPDNSGPLRAPIIHLLLGAKAMSEVQENIGENTDFSGTGPGFTEVITNLQYIVDSLDESNNPAIGDLNDLDLSASPEIQELKDQIVGTINFLRDAGDITISIGNFGIVASPTLVSMNQTLSIFNPASSGYANFTVIPDNVYTDSIDEFERTGGIIENATQMQTFASEVNTKISTLETRSSNQEYGFLSDSAGQFSTEFNNFDLEQNADNFLYLSGAFNSLIWTMFTLKDVDETITDIETSVSSIQTKAGIGVGSLSEIQTELDDINGNITIANSTLDVANTYIGFAAGNFSSLQGMPQLAATGASFTSISVHIVNIQVGDGGSNGGLTRIANIAADTGSWTASLPQSAVDNVNILAGELDYINTEFAAIQTDLGGVSIAS